MNFFRGFWEMISYLPVPNEEDDETMDTIEGRGAIAELVGEECNTEIDTRPKQSEGESKDDEGFRWQIAIFAFIFIVGVFCGMGICKVFFV